MVIEKHIQYFSVYILVGRQEKMKYIFCYILINTEKKSRAEREDKIYCKGGLRH